MLAPATMAFEPDELRFAQIACTKLTGLVQGTLSIGLPALRTRVPEPRGFFESQFRLMNAYAEVLSHVAGKQGCLREAQQLRQQGREIQTSFENLRGRLLHCADSSDEPDQMTESARHAASTVCDAIAAYADLIQLDRSRIARVKEVVLQVFDALGNLNPVGPSANVGAS